jgi:hypothetical protein
MPVHRPALNGATPCFACFWFSNTFHLVEMRSAGQMRCKAGALPRAIRATNLRPARPRFARILPNRRGGKL